MPSYPTRLVAYPPAETALKHDVMTHFGHVCVCSGCGEHQLLKLHLDHTHGGGNAERRAMKRQGSSFYREVKAAIDRDAPGDRIWLATLQILCLACHTSKSKHGACHIHHTGAVMDEEAQEIREDSHNDDHTEKHPMLTSNKRTQAKALMQLSTRVEPHIKQWLDELSENQGISIGAVLGQLKTKIEQGEVARHSEFVKFFAYQRQVNGEILTLLSDLALKGSDPDPRGESALDVDHSHAVQAHRHDAGIFNWDDPPTDTALPPPVIPKRRWFKRF